MPSSRRVFQSFGIITSLLAILSACSPRSAIHNSRIRNWDPGIIGGVAVDPSDEIAHSTVAIGTLFSGNFCSGTLVAPNLVVTAAHCTSPVKDPRMLIVIFGADLSKKDLLQTRKVQGGLVPDAWPALSDPLSKNEGDIALLKFEGTAPIGFQPMRLLANADALKSGMNVTLVGYGLTNMQPEINPKKLMKADVKLSDPEFAATEMVFDSYLGRGACHGDSGGPAFTVLHNKTFLIGVTSRSVTESGGQSCLEGTIYTSIPGHIEFLKRAARFLNSDQFVAGQTIPQPQSNPQ